MTLTYWAWATCGQTKSQVDSSWKLGSTRDYVWPGLAFAFCQALRVFHRLAIQPKSTQVEWRPLTYCLPMKQRIVCLKLFFFFFFRRLACICEETCEETCESVWTPNASLYPSSRKLTQVQLASPCDYFAGPFGLKASELGNNHEAFSMSYTLITSYLKISAVWILQEQPKNWYHSQIQKQYEGSTNSKDFITKTVTKSKIYPEQKLKLWNIKLGYNTDKNIIPTDTSGYMVINQTVQNYFFGYFLLLLLLWESRWSHG